MQSLTHFYFSFLINNYDYTFTWYPLCAYYFNFNCHNVSEVFIYLDKIVVLIIRRNINIEYISVIWSFVDSVSNSRYWNRADSRPYGS
jgi:hypothetical protein